MVELTWKRENWCKHGIVWTLYLGKMDIAKCFYLGKPSRYICRASVPAPGGVVLLDFLAGSAACARKLLERELDKRSIYFFNEDVLEFKAED